MGDVLFGGVGADVCATFERSGAINRAALVLEEGALCSKHLVKAIDAFRGGIDGRIVDAELDGGEDFDLLTIDLNPIDDDVLLHELFRRDADKFSGEFDLTGSKPAGAAFAAEPAANTSKLGVWVWFRFLSEPIGVEVGFVGLAGFFVREGHCHLAEHAPLFFIVVLGQRILLRSTRLH